jgi:ubiquinone/menaquinone biosynthesis C-methylase UbiE
MQKGIEEMRRVLKPTGLLYFVNTELLQKKFKSTRLDKSLWKEVYNLNSHVLYKR